MTCVGGGGARVRGELKRSLLQIGPERIGQLAASHARFLRVGLSRIEGVRLRDSPNPPEDEGVPPRCGIVTFDVSRLGMSAQALDHAHSSPLF